MNYRYGISVLMIFAVLTQVLTLGCSHAVLFSTEPKGALVEINGQQVGKTPFTIVESTGWGKMYLLRFSKPGYKPTTVSVVQDRYNDGALAACIVTGLFLLFPLIGIGASRQLEDNYHFVLEKLNNKQTLNKMK